MSLVIDQLGRRARGVGATLQSLCGRRGTVATLLTGSRDCLTKVLSAFSSGLMPGRSGSCGHPDAGSPSDGRSNAAPQRRGGGATYDAPVTSSVGETVTPSVEEIAGMTDPVLRNLHITQRYHELATGLRDAGLGEDATWCAFAVWASKTAGATIRGEVLPARVRQLLVDNEADPGRPAPLQSRGRSLGRRASAPRPPGPRRRRGDGRCRQIDRRRERPRLLGAGPSFHGAARGQRPEPRGDVGGAVGRTDPGRRRRRRDRRGRCLLRLRAGPRPARRASRSGAPGQHAGRVARTAAPAASDQLGLGRGNL